MQMKAFISYPWTYQIIKLIFATKHAITNLYKPIIIKYELPVVSKAQLYYKMHRNLRENNKYGTEL